MRSVLILGGARGIGSAICEEISKDRDTQLRMTYNKGRDLIPKAWDEILVKFNPKASRRECSQTIRRLLQTSKATAVVNCSNFEQVSDSSGVDDALLINSLLPHILATETEKLNIPVISLSSYEVFRPGKEVRKESSAADSNTVYGRSKAIGEVTCSNVIHLRADAIGPNGGVGFFDSIFSSSNVFKVSKDIHSKPVTHKALAKIVRAILRDDVVRGRLPKVMHILSADLVSRYDQAVSLISHLRQERIQVYDAQEDEGEQSIRVDTEHPKEHKALWEAAGFEEIPTFDELAELEYVC